VDLKGAVFAYADPYSNTGYLVPRYEIKRQRR
jgi:phosphonate transport system substrate-binding protein